MGDPELKARTKQGAGNQYSGGLELKGRAEQKLGARGYSESKELRPKGLEPPSTGHVRLKARAIQMG